MTTTTQKKTHKKTFEHKYAPGDIVRLSRSNMVYRVAYVEYADYGDAQFVLYHLIDVNVNPDSLDIKKPSVPENDLDFA